MKIALVSLLISSFLFLYFFGFAEGNQQGVTRLNAVKSLIYNNAETTVKLDSTALKQLVRLSTTGTFSTHKQRLGKGQTAIYDGILTNDGNGYDVRTGIFTCPVAGTYMFVIDCLSLRATFINIVMNKKVVGSVHVSADHPSSTLLQISRTVILKTRKGDQIKVVNAGNNGFINHEGYSGFSGTLLY